MELSQANFSEFALQHYQFAKNSSRDDFTRDLGMFARVNRFLREAIDQKDTSNLLLMINTIVIAYNVFGNIASTRMLAFKVDKKYHRQLKALLIATGRYAGSVEFKNATPCARFYKIIERNLASR